MTYFQFLLIFLGIPLILVGAATLWDARRGRGEPPAWGARRPWVVILAHVFVAVVYTTPWDNYLVATGVWWYPPERVVGLTLGWVPIEEYTFFVLQSLLAGLWLLWLARRLPVADFRQSPRLRGWSTLILGGIWLVVAIPFFSGWQPITYLALILLWALPPVMLQLAVGADILWRARRPVGLALASLTLYLAAADFLAIGDGIWTIDPAQSLQIYLGGVLPLEEFLFFLTTNVLLVFGVTLVLAPEMHARARRWVRQLRLARSRRLLEES